MGCTPYAFRLGIWSRGKYPSYLAVLRAEWQPYLDGHRTFEEAIERIAGRRHSAFDECRVTYHPLFLFLAPLVSAAALREEILRALPAVTTFWLEALSMLLVVADEKMLDLVRHR